MSDERLDEETEQGFNALIVIGNLHADGNVGSVEECQSCQQSISALRSRIRFLIEEARRSEGRKASESIDAYFDSEA